MDNTWLYPYSAEEAHRRNELADWRESFRANIACREAIENAIRRDFDGMYLKEGCAQSVIAEYGYKRVSFVLANTLREKDHDGRFSRANKEWGGRTFIQPDKAHNYQFAVESHPAVLDGFINQYRQAYAALGLFGDGHCEPDSKTLDYEGRVLVLSPETLKESCWSQENQLWLCTGGFGARPGSRGRAVFATCLGDGEEARWERSDFTGVLKDEHLPGWAREKLEELTSPEQSGLQMGGMDMN